MGLLALTLTATLFLTGVGVIVRHRIEVWRERRAPGYFVQFHHVQPVQAPVDWEERRWL